MEYKFKRDIYKEIKMSIVNNIVTFLFGPRKCGKTICMKQIHTDIEYSKYKSSLLNFVSEDVKIACASGFS